MLKLKRGQRVNTKGGATYFIVEVTENIVFFTAASNLIGSVIAYTNEFYLNQFKYEEPFEPKDGDCVYFLTGTTPHIEQDFYDSKREYLFNKVFKTEKEAQVFLDKVNSL